MKMEQPLVSVAMPVYNAEKYLRMAIDSVLNQTYAHLELVIVNDASVDHSRDIILSYTDPRIRYIENEVNLGISKTRNKCVEHAKGKYIAVMDNDDIAMPDRLERQVRFMRSDFNYAVCGSFYDVIDAAGNISYKIKLPVTDKEVKTFLLFNNCFCNSSVMIQGNLLKERKYEEGFDMIEDYYFLYTMSKAWKLSNLPYFTTQYRVHGKNTSIKKLDGMRSIRAKMDRMILGDLEIPFTEEEFYIHTNFVTANFGFFGSIAQLEKLEEWLLKLYDFIADTGQYDMNLVMKIFVRRWLLIIRPMGKEWHKVLFNKLFRKFKLKYIGLILAFIAEKYSSTRSVS